jgi:hypothetical protein
MPFEELDQHLDRGVKGKGSARGLARLAGNVPLHLPAGPVARLRALGLTPIVPQGAYYVLADVSRLGCENARRAAMTLLESCHVAAVPGSCFYRNGAGENLLRFCFAVDMDLLREACRRIRAFA